MARFGLVSATEYYNVLLLRVEDVQAFPERLRKELAADTALAQSLGRVMPLSTTFRFQNAEEFERQARIALQPWSDELRGRRFYVRMHRRGFRGRLSSQQEEQFLDRFLLDAAGGESRIDFEDPDLTIAVETVGQQGGVSCWSRAQRQRYPFLKLE